MLHWAAAVVQAAGLLLFVWMAVHYPEYRKLYACFAGWSVFWGALSTRYLLTVKET